MVQRIGPVDRNDGWPRRASLAGYRLLFNMQGEDGKVYANIEAAAESTVLGVVYRCTSDALRIMDHYESGYERQVVTVICENGERLDVIAYVALPDHVAIVETAPTDEYLQKIVAGAREQGLPEDYLREIMGRLRKRFQGDEKS